MIYKFVHPGWNISYDLNSNLFIDFIFRLNKKNKSKIKWEGKDGIYDKSLSLRTREGKDGKRN
jgi:hypothetical protein